MTMRRIAHVFSSSDPYFFNGRFSTYYYASSRDGTSYGSPYNLIRSQFHFVRMNTRSNFIGSDTIYDNMRLNLKIN